MILPCSRRQLLGTTGALFATTVAGCSGDDGSTSPGDQTSSPSPAQTTTQPTDSSSPTPQRQSVSFDSPAGTTVEGTLFGSGTCGVVLVPQINLDRESWFPQAERLASQGLVALPIDEGDQRAAAVRGAVEFLRSERDVDRVVLVGASTGGEAVVIAGAKSADRVDGVVTLSAAGGGDYADQLSGPKLFVVSRADERRFVRIAEQLHEKASDPKQLVTYDGDAHGQRLFESDHRESLWDELDSLTNQICSS